MTTLSARCALCVQRFIFFFPFDSRLTFNKSAYCFYPYVRLYLTLTKFDFFFFIKHSRLIAILYEVLLFFRSTIMVGHEKNTVFEKYLEKWHDKIARHTRNSIETAVRVL